MSLAILLLAIYTLIIIAVWFALKKSNKSKTDRLFEGSNLTPVNNQYGLYEGQKDNLNLQTEYFAGTNKRAPYLKIFLSCPSHGKFETAQESGFDRFFKKLGIAVELQTGDANFDQQVYITSNTVPFVRSYFADANKREALLEMINLGFKTIKYNGERFELVQSPFRASEGAIKTILEKATPYLRELVQNVSLYAPPSDSATLGWKFNRWLMFGLASLCLTFGIVSFILSLYYTVFDAWEMFLSSLKYSVAVFILFAWGALKLLKGRSSSHRELMAIWTMSLIGLVLLSYGTMNYYNCYFDQAPAQEHILPVVYKQIKTHHKRRGGETYSYHLYVDSWRRLSHRESLSVSINLYHSVTPGVSRLRILTKPGRLGFEWLSYYERINDVWP